VRLVNDCPSEVRCGVDGVGGLGCDVEDELERGLGDSEVGVDVAEFGGLGAEGFGEIGGSVRWGDEPTFC
jgi:hypothetical protein